MASDTLEPEIEPDKTQPPVSALRYDTPQELYTHMPSLAQMTQHRPREGEDALDFLYRLRGSTTPEEAVVDFHRDLTRLAS